MASIHLNLSFFFSFNWMTEAIKITAIDYKYEMFWDLLLYFLFLQFNLNQTIKSLKLINELRINV